MNTQPFMTKYRWVALLTAVLLSGCFEDKDEMIEASSATCTPAYINALRAGKTRESLAERCMTRGGYQYRKPETF